MRVVKLCSYINEINQSQHYMKHNANTYELKVISGQAVVTFTLTCEDKIKEI